MSHRSFPPSHYSPQPFPSSVLAAAVRVNPAPIRKREPYTVERYPCVQGGILLVGYDGRGEVVLELRVPATRFSDRMLDKMRRWLKANDDQPAPLAIVPD